MTDELRNQKPNETLKEVSKALESLKEFENKAHVPEAVPLIGGAGLGDLLVGKAPEEVEHWAYGESPVEMTPTSHLPQLKENRKQSLVDALFTGAQVAAPLEAAGKGTFKLGEKLAKRAVGGATSESRREFMKKAAMGAGALAAAPLLKRLPKGTAEKAVEGTAEKAAIPAAERVVEDTLVRPIEQEAVAAGGSALEKMPFQMALSKMLSDHTAGNLADNLHDMGIDIADHYDPMGEEIAKHFTPEEQEVFQNAASKLEEYPNYVKQALFESLGELDPEYTVGSYKLLEELDDPSLEAGREGFRKKYLKLKKNSKPIDSLIEDAYNEGYIEEPAQVPAFIKYLDPNLPELNRQELEVYKKFLDHLDNEVGNLSGDPLGY